MRSNSRDEAFSFEMLVNKTLLIEGEISLLGAASIFFILFLVQGIIQIHEWAQTNY
jgi:hypothetical protein